MTITKDNIFISDEPEPNLQGFPSVGHFLKHQLTVEFPNRVLLVDALKGTQWTGVQLWDKILTVACCLRDVHHFKPDTMTCISYDHSDTTVILALGILCAGGAVACAFSKDPYGELLDLSRKVRPKMLFCHAKNLSWATRLSSDLNEQVNAISMDERRPNESKGHIDDLLSYNHLASETSELLPEACNVEDRIAFVLMSSGTTGRPKAIPVMQAVCLGDGFKLTPQESERLVMACSSSLDYVSGRLIIFGGITTGYKSVIVDCNQPLEYLRAVERYKINVVYMGAASFYSLISHPKIDEFDLSSLLAVFPMGAKIIYLKELAQFLAKHPNIRSLRQGYGTSEFSGAAMNKLTPEQYIKDCDNCGRLMRGTKVKIVDPTTGQLMGPNQRGMIHVWNKTLFKGYYDLSSEKGPFLAGDTVFDKDGFYITGDIGYLNEREELFIVGREKELMCCRAAKKVLPQELEQILGEHPAVAKCCVLGIPDKVRLTLHCPRAFVVLKREYRDGSSLVNGNNRQATDGQVGEKENLVHRGEHRLCSMDQDLRRSLAEKLMDYMNVRVGWEKQLTGGIVILDEIPTLRTTGKIDKGYLRTLTDKEVEFYGDRSSGE